MACFQFHIFIRDSSRLHTSKDKVCGIAVEWLEKSLQISYRNKKFNGSNSAFFAYSDRSVVWKYML